MDNPTPAEGRLDPAGFRKDPLGSMWRWLDERLGPVELTRGGR